MTNPKNFDKIKVKYIKIMQNMKIFKLLKEKKKLEKEIENNEKNILESIKRGGVTTEIAKRMIEGKNKSLKKDLKIVKEDIGSQLKILGIIVVPIAAIIPIFVAFVLPAIEHFSHEKLFLKIVDIKKNSVAYSNGNAEIVVWDTFGGDYIVYGSKVKAILDGDQYLAPTLNYLGGTWDRVVYSYNSGKNNIDMYCDHNIFYMDRDSRIARTSYSDFCVRKTLDEHDIKYFLGTKYTGEVAIIGYSDLKTLATIKILYASPEKPIVSGMVASNWELTKLIIPVGTCDRGTTDATKIKLFLWDVKNDKLEDKTPANFNCDISKIRYERSDDKFHVVTEMQGEYSL